MQTHTYNSVCDCCPGTGNKKALEKSGATEVVADATSGGKQAAGKSKKAK
jgi:hypothetical protein